MIQHLNEDKLIDGILVQLPLPKELDTNKIIKTIDPNKDVDGFHPDNTTILSPVHATVLEILSNKNIDLEDKEVVIVSNSETFGNPLAKLLTEKKASTKVINSTDIDLEKETARADVLITAIGKPHFFTSSMIKEEAVIIDIGITKKAKKGSEKKDDPSKKTSVFGDVDYDDVLEKVSYITPVPGGVGPMTIAMLFKNTLQLYKSKH